MGRAADAQLARQVAAAIVKRLREQGHLAYFAGGCVRDALLGLRPTDFDVATDATPARVREIFPRTAEVGAAFGVVLVHELIHRHNVSVEVATFRSDGPYSDARRPDTIHFSDPPSDAARRDFTINALFLDPLDETQDPQAPGGGHIIDHVGGLKDLEAGLLRAVGDPERRLAEDHLRALRAVRFAARLGFAIDAATAAAVRRHAAELRGVSRERIGDEVRRMLAHPRRARAAELIQDLGLDAPVLNEPTLRVPLGTLAGLHERAPLGQSLAAWALDRLAAGATGVDEAQAASVVSRYRASLMLSNLETEELAGLLRTHRALVDRWPGARVSQRKRWAATGTFSQAVELVAIHRPESARAVREAVAALGSDGVGIAPIPLVTGDDLTAMGMKPGPAYRRILDEVYDAQLEGKVRDLHGARELAARLNV